MSQENSNQNNDIEPPPFFRTWGQLYSFVLGTLAVLIILFYIFTKIYE